MYSRQTEDMHTEQIPQVPFRYNGTAFSKAKDFEENIDSPIEPPKDRPTLTEKSVSEIGKENHSELLLILLLWIFLGDDTDNKNGKISQHNLLLLALIYILIL